MPCRDDWGPTVPATYDGFSGGQLVVMLCKTLKLLRRRGIATPDFLKQFERVHAKYDAERVRGRVRDRAEHRAKIKALGKLTSAERKILGLR